MEPVWLGETPCPAGAMPVEGGFVEIDGETYARIANVDRLAPFLMSIVSNSDVWLFAGSNGPFTAGRVEPDGAMFPYQTADKVLRHPDSSGALSVFLVRRAGRTHLWEPLRESGRAYRIRRNLYKHVCGTSAVFEEVNEDLGVAFRWELSACEPYGVVRECRLENVGTEPVEVRFLDGWQQLITPGVGQETHARFSYLAAGYMRHERAGDLPLGIFTLNAGLSDTADPAESLRVTAAWSLGHSQPAILLCDRQVEAFRRGEAVQPEDEMRGEYGAFLVADSVTLAPGAVHAWVHAVDTRLDHAALIKLRGELEAAEALAENLRRSVAANREGLRRMIAGADGLQKTADTAASAHHFANVLFNCMRGGAFADGYRFGKDDLAAFVRARSTVLAAKHARWLAALPDTMELNQIRTEAARTGDPQLVRLAREYLPLTFSRRHGDPSRPWNHFAIRLKDAAGKPLHGYQGNWRDIFQNWESLATSYPDALESMIAVFLNASTADGYNPYRITRDGVDWEIADPKDPWSHIGYWGDHQIVYLLRLLESFERFQPGCLAASLGDETYSYAQVPYEIAGFERILEDPRHTITFHHDLHQRLVAREQELGADGRLLRDSRGEVALVSLAEKLIVPLLAKLSNLVPDGGIWLNTQRPEWNDANNALAGWGLSVVTVQYIRRYLAFLDGVLASAGDGEVSLSASVASFLGRLTGILEGVTGPLDEAARFAAMAALGRAGEDFRTNLYACGLEGRECVRLTEIRALIAAALPVIDATIWANRREDGLFHSYNVLQAAGERAGIKRLNLMLEGQVAALSAGVLSPAEALAVLRALRASDLYRPDQDSYLLYPDRNLPRFDERNTLPANSAERAPLLGDLLAAGDSSLITADEHGAWHFQADLRNARDLSARLDTLAAQERWRDAVACDSSAVLDLWEEVFRHSEFTGRSGTFFMFEGLGSIYWHMVAKLLVAAQECWREAAEGPDTDTAAALADAYDRIRDGLGFRKRPDVYGAFPTDPYSHSPHHRGAQQPGMTGQVKEEILTRWGELGVEVEGGRLRFAPRLLHRAEFLPEPASFEYVDGSDAPGQWNLPAGSLAFTCCQTPVCYRLADAPGLTVEWSDERTEQVAGTALDAAVSASVFGRRGEVRRITVNVVAEGLRA